MIRRSIKGNIATFIRYGFFHVFGANVVNKLVAFAANIFIVRFLTQTEYGVFSYSFTFYSVATLLTGLGVLTGVFLYCSENRPEPEKNDYYSYGLIVGFLIDVVLMVLLFGIGVFGRWPIEGAGIWICAMAPLLLFDFLYQYEAIVIRTKKRNKLYSRLLIINSVLYGFLSCFGAYIGGIGGTVIGRYAAFAMTIICGLMMMRSFPISIRRKSIVEVGFDREFWSYSLSVCTINLTTFFALMVDIMLVGWITGDADAVACYKVATLIPEGLYFIPSSAIATMQPYIVERNNDARWLKSVTIKLIGGMSLLMAFVMAAMVLSAHPLIFFLWGEHYAPSVLPYQILNITLVTTTLKLISMNVCLMCKVSRPNLLISILSLALDIILIVVLTPAFGIIGTACSVLVADVVAALLSIGVLSVVLKKKGRLPNAIDG